MISFGEDMERFELLAIFEVAFIDGRDRCKALAVGNGRQLITAKMLLKGI